MRSARPWPLVAAALTAVVVAGCLLTTPLDGFVGATPSTEAGSDAAPIDGAPGADAAGADAAGADAAGAVAVASCAALKQQSPATPDGVQLIDPDGAGPLPAFPAYCDMTSDGGGWMLVTSALLGAETNKLATVTRMTDARGGVIMRVYANSGGCAMTDNRTRHRIFIQDLPAWTKVRFAQTFAGGAGCWHIFGGQEDPTTFPLDPNLIPLQATDVIRDAVRMGGARGDAFDGITNRCDGAPENFWAGVNGGSPRSATVILRRSDITAPSGVETGADCCGFGPGETSPTWWEYRDIYVR